MYSTFPIASKVPITGNRKRIHSHNQKFYLVKGEVNIATTTDIKRRNTSSLLSELSINVLPQTYQNVCDIVRKQSSGSNRWSNGDDKTSGNHMFQSMFLQESYERCRNICAEYAKTFYLGTLLMTEERQKAIWAIYVWCRRTDELVDGPNAAHLSSTLDRWEERLQDVFNGKPFDMLDAALAHTVFKFPLDIKPFRDMIEGMRMDTRKNRYANFQELYLYCYNVAGTVGLMSVPIMGIAPEAPLSAQKIYNGAVCLGIGNQLTNILRDVGEDAGRGRVYLPQDELAQFELTDDDIFSRKISANWREFMKQQINRARFYFDQAEEGASQLDQASRWPVWSSLMMYRMILDSIEQNDYDNLTRRAYVGRTKRLCTLPFAYVRAVSTPIFNVDLLLSH
ncbi:hypothetical protein Leryth_003896 [Lithospermum erythrorhizon]|nr:hypothetical protein Leryth_003896 [Lithospermum erythrorhizon]